MTSPLTSEERERVRHHMGYMSVQPAASIQFGLPRPSQTAFMIESAMENLMPEAAPRVRDILRVLDDIEQKLLDAQCYLVADELDEIKLAGSRDPRGRLVTDRLEDEYVRWAKRLADIFGCPLYPFSQRFQRMSAGKTGSVRIRNW